MKTQFRARAFALASVFVLLSIVIVFQMIRIQNSKEAAIFLLQADRYAGRFETLFPERGIIYDRQRHMLAGNKTVYEIAVNLAEAKDPDTIAKTLNNILGVDYQETLDNIANPPEGLLSMVVIDFVPPEKALQIMAYKKELSQKYSKKGDASLAGLDFKQHLMRSYPENTLASNIIGFVTLENKGYFGVEDKYNDLLAGVPITVWVPTDPNRASEMPKAPKGADLVLTIDREIQSMLESELQKGMVETGSSAGTIIIMDPHTGGILGMASTPQMNLNDFSNYEKVYNNASEYNRAVSTQYEPGSVFKILTMAAAIDQGIVTPHTAYLDVGFYEIGGAYIYNWDQGAWGPQDMIGCLQHSLNVCFARLADQLGEDTFYTYMRRFGIGHPTGIDISAETNGRLKVPGDEDWYKVDLGTNSFGQGVAVSPIQLLTAASALANDGKMVYPHVLYSMLTNGNQYNTPAQTLGTPISPQTARTVSDMLAIAMEEGQSQGRVEGYRLAGKTGTAQIPGPDGLYDPDLTNASFLGWGPVDDPRFMVYVWMERPQNSEWAAFVAAPIFHNIVEKLVILMDIPPDEVRQQLTGYPAEPPSGQ